MERKDPKFKKELIFLAKFFVIFFAAEFLINSLDFSALENFLASAVASLVGMRSSGNLIFAQTGIFEVGPSCTGLVSATILGAIIFSLKKPKIKQKIMIFAAGAVLLSALNYLRVALVVLIGEHYGMGTAEIVHVASWFSTALFVIFIWYEFTKKLTGVKNFSGFL